MIIGDAQLLAHNARTLDLQCGYEIVRRDETLPRRRFRTRLSFISTIFRDMWSLESSQATRAGQRPKYIEAAVELCAAGSIDAIATAPINKRALFLGGYSFPGHTEFLAHLTSTEDYAMGFVAVEPAECVLISTHVPLSEAIGLVRRERFEKTIRLADLELRPLGHRTPADRRRGAESARRRRRTVRYRGVFRDHAARSKACNAMDDINVSGPYSADTVFLRASRGEFDAVIACYHDQAMIPVKCLSFGEAVNVTLGLPFIRTSVDHGTAFDIAGKGIAEHSSMVEAIKLAAELSLKAGESGRALEAA